MKNRTTRPLRWKTLVACMAAGLPGLMLASAAQAQETFKIGIVTFLSGPAAESFGVPGVNGAKLVIEAANKGKMPKPYDKTGFGGMKIEPVVIDESGGATKQVQELRNLFQREGVDAVVGYLSSGDCLAVAPVAEELKKVLILADCGTPRVFEEASYKYVFRSAGHSGMDTAGLARYLQSRKVKTDTINLINQDYAFGLDSRSEFIAAMQHVNPKHKIGADLLPKFGAGQYGTEISALSRQRADLLYSSLWGGDLQAFLLQAAPRGLFKQSAAALLASDHVLAPLGEKMPDGVIVGARGSYGVLARKNPLNDWFMQSYQEAYNKAQPVQGSYRMVQSVLGLKAAIEKAMAKNGGKKPSAEEIADALRGLDYDTPGGVIQMKLSGGQQAIQPYAFGKTRYDKARKVVTVEDVQQYSAECLSPPEGTKSMDWLKAGFPGKNCD